MKKLILSCSLMALTLPAYAADTINCATLPSCDDLGYTENADDCVGRKLLCPFDKTQAACLEAPQVGDLKYSLYSSNHDGWLPCDGKQYKEADYQDLYNLIGSQFCHKYTSRTDTSTTSSCEDNYFAVPDYRGFYLRGLNAYLSSDSTVGAPSTYYGYALKYKGDTGTVKNFHKPQYEQLPNITGKSSVVFNDANNTLSVSGAFSYSNYGTAGYDSGGYDLGQGTLSFDASSDDTIYDGSHVRPAHYGAYIYIYAGE